jgi:hypothetical protein
MIAPPRLASQGHEKSLGAPKIVHDAQPPRAAAGGGEEPFEGAVLAEAAGAADAEVAGAVDAVVGAASHVPGT